MSFHRRITRLCRLVCVFVCLWVCLCVSVCVCNYCLYQARCVKCVVICCCLSVCLFILWLCWRCWLGDSSWTSAYVSLCMFACACLHMCVCVQLKSTVKELRVRQREMEQSASVLEEQLCSVKQSSDKLQEHLQLKVITSRHQLTPVNHCLWCWRFKASEKNEVFLALAVGICRWVMMLVAQVTLIRWQIRHWTCIKLFSTCLQKIRGKCRAM